MIYIFMLFVFWIQTINITTQIFKLQKKKIMSINSSYNIVEIE